MNRLTKSRLARLNRAKSASHAAWVACNDVIMCLDETADSDIVLSAQGAKRQAWLVYDRLVLATEW